MNYKFLKQRFDKIRVKRKYKDTIFQKLFHDKKKLLSLYNAMSGKHYTNPEELEIVTLDNAVYLNMKNDLAFLIDLGLYLYEHQSTVNPNMPYRFLQYVASEYSRIIVGEDIYGGKLINLPAPHFVVFYNGTAKQPERHVLKLSDAYGDTEEEAQLELEVIVLNINEGFNEELKEQCQTLREYMQFVNRVRKNALNMSREDAVEQAVDECIEEGILREFLLENKAEVKRMNVLEYDEKAVKRAIQRVAQEEGREEGREEGELIGRAKVILELLEELEPVSDDMCEIIMRQNDLDVLKEWMKAALKADSLANWKRLVEWQKG